MPRFDSEPVEVRMGDCECPGVPHPGGDLVYLAPRLSFLGGERATALIMSGLDDPDDAATSIVEVYLRNEVQGWNLSDAEGRPVPYDAEVLLSDWQTAKLVGEKADELYSEAVLRPLREAALQSSAGGPTAPSTSRTTRRAAKRPRQ